MHFLPEAHNMYVLTFSLAAWHKVKCITIFFLLSRNKRKLLKKQRSVLKWSWTKLYYLENATKQIKVALALHMMFTTKTHCLGMNYYVNFLGGIGSNGFHIKWIFSTQDNWKKLKSWGWAVLELPAKGHTLVKMDSNTIFNLEDFRPF